MKKIKFAALFLALCLTFGAIPALGAADSTYILLRPENFTFPQPAGDWRLAGAAPSGGSGISGSALLGGTNAMGAGAVEAEVFIPKAGTYAVWGLGYDGGNSVRYGYIGVDGTYDTAKIGSPVGGTWAWTRCAQTVTLTEGLHTFSVKVAAPTMTLFAIMITDDLELTLSNETDFSTLVQYEDTVAPTISGNITETAGTVTFPEATDNLGVKKVVYKVDGEEVELTDGAYALPEMAPLAETTVEMLAYDGHGNVARVSETFVNSPVKLSVFDLTVEGETARLTVSAVNNTEAEITLFAAVCAYNADYTRMTGSRTAERTLAVGESAEFTVELAVSGAAEGEICGLLWDSSANIEPMTATAVWEVQENA